MVWDACHPVSSFVGARSCEDADDDSCPAEEQCLCDVFGVGDCT